MKRWLRRRAVYLVLGVLTTVAVAWFCAGVVRVRHGDLVTVGAGDGERRTWLMSVYERPGARWIDAIAVWDVKSYRQGRYERVESRLEHDLYDWSGDLTKPPDPERPFFWRHVASARGWPLPALRSERSLDDTLRQSGKSAWTSRLDEPDARADEPPLLYPREPLWGGVIVDSLFYGLVWLVILQVFVPVWIWWGRRGAIFALAASLLLGTGSTVFIAWSCAWLVDVHERRISVERHETTDDGENRLWMREHRTAGATRVYTYTLPNRFAFPPMAAGSTRAFPVIVDDGRGWPWPALGATLHGTAAQRAPHTIDRIEHGFRIEAAETLNPNGSLEKVRILPFRIRPAGFAADIGLHAGFWWLLLTCAAVPRWIRGLKRKKRGLCVPCGYDLGGADHATCPECGVTLLHQPAVTSLPA
ncbi:MAG: hypothetical protein ACYTGC_00520 [Planctomycetota bacterium]|jgi:hypothetical protein